MTFKSSTQPFCRCCGKAIRKYTTVISFGHEQPRREDFWESRTERPRDRKAAAAFTNQQIVSLSWCSEYAAEKYGRYINKVTIWDGESYAEEFFCTNRCAQALAHSVAKQGFSTKAYRDALEPQTAARHRLSGERS